MCSALLPGDRTDSNEKLVENRLINFTINYVVPNKGGNETLVEFKFQPAEKKIREETRQKMLTKVH